MVNKNTQTTLQEYMKRTMFTFIEISSHAYSSSRKFISLFTFLYKRQVKLGNGISKSLISLM